MIEPSRLRIAMQKSGRLADASLDLLQRCGIHFARSKDKLFLFGKNMPVDVLLVRDDDIPQLLSDSVCDLGIVGENVAEEARLEFIRNGEDLTYKSLIPLNYGQCRLSLALPENDEYQGPQSFQSKRIATTYPYLVQRWLQQNGVEADIVRLKGSVEVAPSSGIADAICDLVSTGATLRANHLKEVVKIFESTAQIYCRETPFNREKQEILDRLLPRINSVLTVDESKYVMLHAPRSALQEIKSLLPGAETPTVLPLEGSDDRVAVHAVCRESVFWEHLEELKAAGASAVLVLPVEKMLA